MAQVLIRNIDVKVVERLKVRAQQHGRSLEAELRGILERAAGTDLAEGRELAERIRRRLRGRNHTDSAILLADDRSR